MLPLRDNLRFSEFPYLTALLVTVNLLVFFVWQTGDAGSTLDLGKVVHYGTVPYEVTHPGVQCMPEPPQMQQIRCMSESELEQRWGVRFPSTWTTLFTSMFMHASIGHLIGNMLFLIVFGIAVEAGMGRRSFALFYLVGGLGADLAHTLFDPNSPIPALGASGAISAVMGGYVMMYPRAKIFAWIIPGLPFVWGWIRAAWLIGALMLLQVVEAYLILGTAFGGSGGGVAYFAHFGGFAAGVALTLIALDRESLAMLRRRARIASGDEELVLEKAEPAVARPATAPEPGFVGEQRPANENGIGPKLASGAQAPTRSAAPAAAMPDPFAARQAAAPGSAPLPPAVE